jgi:hypothetical protein
MVVLDIGACSFWGAIAGWFGGSADSPPDATLAATARVARSVLS